MCGIAGILGLRPVNRDAVAAMTSLLAHRGPDGDGLWSDPTGQVVFGHRRLAVIDPTPAGHQPMSDASGDLTITYNGELYNYIELADELRTRGVTFRTDTDTEVILEAYRHWGADCVARFNGMFAFAIHDRRAETVFCARDRFGEKPFLYGAGEGFFAFASEYKALFALSDLPVAPDHRAIVGFLASPARSLDTGPGTAFGGIGQLRPGECLTVDCRNLSVTRRAYWTPKGPFAETQGEFPEVVNRFRECLQDAVKIRMRSDVPLGSCLSGGLDSGSIYGIVRNLVGEEIPYNVFTGRFPGTDADEGEFADAIAARGNAVRHEVSPDPDRMLGDLADFVWHNELPVDSASQYAQWCVFRLAAENGVTVLLDGQGGDEVLAGYEQYFAAYLADRRRVGETVGEEEAAIRKRYPLALSMRDQSWKRTGPHFLRKAAALLTGRGTDLMFGVRRDFISDIPAETADIGLAAALRRDSHGGFLTTLLRYGDRNSMAHSREVRLPFCDHRLFELAQTLPPEFLMGDAQTKRLLREATNGILPDTIRHRWNKQGFLPPVVRWMQDGLIDAVEARIETAAFSQNPVWDAGWWRRALKRFRAGETGLASPLWKVFVADAWREHFVERATAMEKLSALAPSDTT